MSRLRILLSAYACEPDKGSEPGLGWELAIGLARVADVHVVTRANNRPAIEAILSKNTLQHIPVFHYFDLSASWLQFKRLSRSHRWYYHVWQRKVRPLVGSLIRSHGIDVAHHATFASFRYPTAVAGHGIPSIWGPVGGVEQTPWPLLPWQHPRSLVYEITRNLSNGRFQQTVRSHAKEWSSYSKVLASTKETRSMFQSAGINADLMPAIGLDEARTLQKKVERSVCPDRALRLLYVGNLVYLKGVQWAISALVDSPPNATLSVVGCGDFLKSLSRRARLQGVENRVRFLGRVSRSEVGEIYAGHDIFIFPSLHDSGGMAVLEAMLAGLPVIAADCGGPALAVNSSCGFLIKPSTSVALSQGITSALHLYHADRKLLLAHGANARKRAMECYGWDKKIKSLSKVYESVRSKMQCDKL